MKRTGAALAVYALEQVGVRRTFGIPGVHTTELYDALAESELITPYLVTHECGAAFMADGVSRTSGSIGTLVIVPAAGLTHAMSGIGEAYLDGIPLLVISGGTRRDQHRAYQLHQIDQGRLADGVVKDYTLVQRHADIVPAIYRAYETATRGEPGPVLVEIPAELQLFEGPVPVPAPYAPTPQPAEDRTEEIRAACDLLTQAKRPGLYVGWGAVGAVGATAHIADQLGAPVATTFQGISAFPASHPLHVGAGFGPASVPAARKAFDGCDCLLAAGVRFAELATGSYGMPVPETLIHVDINPRVFDRNYPATVRIAGDATEILERVAEELNARGVEYPQRRRRCIHGIDEQKRGYAASWRGPLQEDRVSPGHFFAALRERFPEDLILAVDDGKHTFLAAELFPVVSPRGWISPTDFNCMGYAVPAAIGAKLAAPDRPVAAVVGDGAFLMTGMELLTAATYGAAVAVFVFHDGELGQIAQFQKLPLNRKTCTVLGKLNVEGVALATGVEFRELRQDREIASVLADVTRITGEGRPVLVDVRIDYSRKTNLTKGVLMTNLGRFPTREKLRFVTRALKRRVTG